MTSLPHYYDVTNSATMTSLPRFYDVTNPATMTSLTPLLWRHYPATMTSLPRYYDVTNPHHEPFYYVIILMFTMMSLACLWYHKLGMLQSPFYSCHYDVTNPFTHATMMSLTLLLMPLWRHSPFYLCYYGVTNLFTHTTMTLLALLTTLLWRY